MLQRWLFFLLLPLLLAACERHHPSVPRPAPSVYFWRTTLSLDGCERDFLRHYRVKKMYVRFFDVALDADARPMPVATLQFAQSLPDGLEVVPVVFITEPCLRHAPKDFATKVAKRVLQMVETHGVRGVREVQIDCDWMGRSQAAYFDFLEKVRGMKIPVLLLINKIDESDQKSLGDIVERWHALLPNAEILPISAKNKFGTDLLLRRIQELLPESPPYFDKDQLTDKPARFFVSEIIREKILLYYDKEIPYSVEVKVERFKETEKKIHINAVIYVERESQKGIVIGHQGVALKKVSIEARKALERFFDKEVYLETFVKVDKDWRSSKKELDSFGYNPE